MGQYPITAGVFGKALAIPGTGNAAITPSSAWLFENQSGTLGTNYNSSQVYVGVTGNVVAILSDTVGLQDTVTGLNLAPIFPANPSYPGFAAGTGYFTADGLATTVVTTVPNSPATVPTGLTVDIVVNVPGTNAFTPGTNYTAGPYEVTGGTAGASGLSGNITGVDAGAITGFDITNGGQGYTTGDVLTIIKAGSDDNATMTLSSAPNGAVTAITIGNNAGTNYSVGDIITVVQAGSGGDCKFAIASVKSLLPVAGDAVTFTAVQAGSVLPVAIDYVITCPTGSVAVK